jgi:hypothetical protein
MRVQDPKSCPTGRNAFKWIGKFRVLALPRGLPRFNNFNALEEKWDIISSTPSLRFSETDVPLAEWQQGGRCSRGGRRYSMSASNATAARSLPCSKRR